MAHVSVFRPLAPGSCQVHRDEVGGLIAIDESAFAVLGWTDAMIGEKPLDYVHPADRARAVDSWLELLTKPGGSTGWRGRLRCGDGSWKWLDIVHQNLLHDPEVGQVISVITEITADVADAEDVRIREQMFRRVTEGLPVGVLQVERAGNVSFANDRLRTMLRMPTAQTIDEHLTAVAEADEGRLRAALDAAMSNHAVDDLEIALRPNVDGSSVVCQVSIRPFTEDGSEVFGAIVCFADITDSVRLRRQFETQANVDALTGCQSRLSLMRHLDELLQRAQPRHGSVGVVFIDLDDFKPVNDRFGHQAGDELLKLVATRLQSCVRHDDIVGRLGGDEFVVIYADVPDPDILLTLAERLRAAINIEAVVATAVVQVKASIGLALESAGLDGASLIAMADSAMYEAKRNRDGRPVWSVPTRQITSP